MLYHAPETRRLGNRQSRHYYDLVKLYENELGRNAIKDTDLLREVAHHKQTFFPAAWAKYETAQPRTLRLAPPDARRSELEQDYKKMQEMIFGEPPSFEELIDVLREVELTINDV